MVVVKAMAEEGTTHVSGKCWTDLEYRTRMMGVGDLINDEPNGYTGVERRVKPLMAMGGERY